MTLNAPSRPSHWSVLALLPLLIVADGCIPDRRNRATLSCSSGYANVFRGETFEEDFSFGCGEDLAALIADGADLASSSYFMSASSSPNGALANAKKSVLSHTGKVTVADETDYRTHDARSIHTFTTNGEPGEMVLVSFEVTQFFSYTDPEAGNVPVNDPNFPNRETRNVVLNPGAPDSVDILALLAQQDGPDPDTDPDGAIAGTVTLELEAATLYTVRNVLNISYLKRGLLLRTQTVKVILPPEPAP